MITKEQYEEAKQIVEDYEHEECRRYAEGIRKKFPIGTKVEDVKGYFTGTVVGYAGYDGGLLLITDPTIDGYEFCEEDSVRKIE